jgi:hypothetical protein
MVALGIVRPWRPSIATVALRELRVVIAESALLYALVRTAPVRARGLLRLADLLWIAGLAVALYALARYASASGVIEAEGVRRARAFYGSPNNLALIIERLLPLALALACWGHSRWRRWGTGVAATAMGVVLALTFPAVRGYGCAGHGLGRHLTRGGRLRRVPGGVALVAVWACWPALLAPIQRWPHS